MAGVILGLSITASGDGAAKVPNVTYRAWLLAVLVTGLVGPLREGAGPRSVTAVMPRGRYDRR